MKNFTQRMAFIFPITFMYMPFIYMFFVTFHRIKYFWIAEYLYPLVFFYLGASISYGLRRFAIKRLAATYKKPLNKYGKLFVDILPYLIVTAFAFLLRDTIKIFYPRIIEMIKEEGFLFPDNEPLYPMLTVVCSAVAGGLGALFANLTLNDYLKRKNIMIYISVFIVAFGLWILGGMIFYQGASMAFSIYLALFLITFFYMRNIILLNIKLDVYTNDEIQNTSVTIKNRSSYMATVALVGIVPIAASLLILPPLLKSLISLGKALFLAIVKWILAWKSPDTPPMDSPDEPSGWIAYGGAGGEDGFLFFYLIGAILALIILYKNRKALKKFIDFLARLFKYKTDEENRENLVLCNEEITPLEREKKKRGFYRHMPYGKFVRTLNGIADAADKYAFAYGYIFWNIVGREADVEESHTPREMTAIITKGGYIGNYAGLDSLTYFYEDIEYGMAKSVRKEQIDGMLDIACNLVKTAKI